MVHTPRLCAEPALAQAKEEVGKVHCQPILSDADLEARKATPAKIESISAASQAGSAVEGVIPAQNLKTTTDDPKVADTGLKDTIKDFVDRISQVASGLNVEQVNVVVARSEDGHLVIQSQGETPSEIVEMLTEQAVNQAADNGPQTGASSQEKLTALLEKLLQHDGQVIDMSTMQQNANGGGQVGTTAGVSQGDKTAGKQHDPQGGKKETAAARNTQMVKEKENFPQKVERYFKAQEAKEKQESSKRGSADADNEDETNKDDKAPASSGNPSVHDEL